MRHRGAAPDLFPVARELLRKAHPHTFEAKKDPKGGALRPMNRVVTSAYLANKHAPNRQKCLTQFSEVFLCLERAIRWVSRKFRDGFAVYPFPKVLREMPLFSLIFQKYFLIRCRRRLCRRWPCSYPLQRFGIHLKQLPDFLRSLQISPLG